MPNMRRCYPFGLNPFRVNIQIYFNASQYSANAAEYGKTCNINGSVGTKMVKGIWSNTLPP